MSTASTITASPTPSLEDRLAAATRRALLPNPFAPRRDLEVAGAVQDGASACCFFDAFWPADGRLALAAARVRRGGIGGALRAACLRRLARDAVALDLSPEDALGLVLGLFAREFGGDGFDLALALLDPASGRLARACHGDASVVVPGAGRDGAVWLACGDAPVDPAWLAAAEDDLTAAARRVAELSGPNSAVVGMIHRPGRRPAAERTFSMPNDLGAIPSLAAQVEAALGEAGAPEGVGAAFALALDELLTNVVSYGYADGGRHEILVDLSVAGGAAELRLRDDGRPFDPLRLPEPDLDADLDARAVGGLGVHFVRQLMDAVDYARETGWNVLRLRKRFVPEQDGS